MSRKTDLIVVACVLVALGAAGVAWHGRAAAARAERELAAARVRIGELEEQIAAARTAADARGVAPRSIAAASGAETRAEGDRPPAPGWRPGRVPDFSTDPEIAPLMLKQRQRQVEARYAALWPKLALAPAQAAKLQALLADKQLSRFDAMGLARRQGLGRDEARELAQQSDAESDGAIRTLIGDAAFAQLQEFDRTYAQRSTVENLSRQLGYAGAALSSAQQEQLIGVLAASSSGPESGGGFGPPGGGPPGFAMRGAMGAFGRDATPAEVQATIERKVAGDAAALQAASAFLTPVQVEALRQSQQAAADQLRLAGLSMERMRKAREGGE